MLTWTLGTPELISVSLLLKCAQSSLLVNHTFRTPPPHGKPSFYFPPSDGAQKYFSFDLFANLTHSYIATDIKFAYSYIHFIHKFIQISPASPSLIFLSFSHLHIRKTNPTSFLTNFPLRSLL